MGRPVVLSNGQIFIGLDESGLVHDFYYPYVGLENLNNARSSHHKIGLWVDGEFSWIDSPDWETSVKYVDNAQISDVSMRSERLHVTLHFTDFIDAEFNALIRKITVTNDHDNKRDIRLFMHQVFQISHAGRADTAMYVPDDNYILDYKGRCCLVIAGQFDDGEQFDQFAIGNYAIEGKDGTFKDAEDGELSNNLIEHGGVDSVLRFKRDIDGHQKCHINYWIIAADSQQDAQIAHSAYKQDTINSRLESVRGNWNKWIQNVPGNIADVGEDKLNAVKHSTFIIKAHCDDRGSILASGDSSIFNYGRDYYCYCWPRDAAYAIWPLLRMGYFDEARHFFEFARDTMHKDGYLMHKYQPDRAIGSTWHPLLHGKSKELAIQEDETASVIYMIGEYYKASGDKTFVHNFFDSFIAPCASFMMNYVDEQTHLPHASYDLWEQKFLTSTYTVSTVIAALQTAASLADALEYPDSSIRWQKSAQTMKDNLDLLYNPEGYFRKGFLLQDDGSYDYDDTVDVSNFYGPYMYAGLELNDSRLVSTVQFIQERLLDTTPIGGVIRYEQDNYFLGKQQYKGNPWVVCTLWLAQYYISINKTDEAERLLNWSLARQLESGALSEQFDPDTGYALSVTPLVWSHAEIINTVLDLMQNK